MAPPPSPDSWYADVHQNEVGAKSLGFLDAVFTAACHADPRKTGCAVDRLPGKRVEARLVADQNWHGRQRGTLRSPSSDRLRQRSDVTVRACVLVVGTHLRAVGEPTVRRMCEPRPSPRRRAMALQAALLRSESAFDSMRALGITLV